MLLKQKVLKNGAKINKDIIIKSLENSGYIIENETDLYELYATHIEYLCNNEIKEVGYNVKK